VEARYPLYIRWSLGPIADAQLKSRDALTGVELPGLCVNPLQVEEWWGDRSVRLWVARRLHDYRHLQETRREGVGPWVLEGREVGRGPDNEPIVTDVRPVCWVADEVVADAIAEIDHLNGDWGPLDRGQRRPSSDRRGA
jgi:hypothetical protein